ncbi:MAG: hypothetical protein ACKVQT_23875 [Burkholderiales bacterium]
MTNKWTYLVALVCACAIADVGIAGPGHDHDEAPMAGGARSPRFEARSETFEVVGVVQGDELAVFVDRYDDNTPVLDASVTIESGAFSAAGAFHAEHGDYSFSARAFRQPGSYPIQITITAGATVDLLAADLVIPDLHADGQQAGATAALRRWGAWGASAAAILLAVGAWRFARGRRDRRLQGAGR